MRKMRRKCEAKCGKCEAKCEKCELNAKQNAKNAKQNAKNANSMQRRIPQGNPNLCKQHQSSMTYLGVWAGSLINLLGSTGPSGLIGP